MDHGILFDHARTARIGLPEAVFCQGKPLDAVMALLSQFTKGAGRPVLFTRLSPEVFGQVPEEIRDGYDYHALSCTAFGTTLPRKPRGRVAVVSAGTADGPVTWEASLQNPSSAFPPLWAMGPQPVGRRPWPVSCAVVPQGVAIMNIDDGYGAACAAARVVNAS